jgi:D-alanyl-D-alanine carboxypeptidase
MARFQHALLSGRLLPAAQLRQMRTTVAGVGYGLGLIRFETPCGVAWGHGGDVPGYASLNVTDGTGRRSAELLFTAHPYDEKTLLAVETLQLAAVCAMLDRPVPAAAGQPSGRPLVSADRAGGVQSWAPLWG